MKLNSESNVEKHTRTKQQTNEQATSCITQCSYILLIILLLLLTVPLVCMVIHSGHGMRLPQVSSTSIRNIHVEITSSEAPGTKSVHEQKYRFSSGDEHSVSAQLRIEDVQRRQLLFDVVGPIARTVGSIAAYGINKLVIDPQREREVFKVWQELREMEQEEGTSQSILPDAIKTKNNKQLTRGQLQGALLSSMDPVQAFSGPDVPQVAPPPILDPRMAVIADKCNASGALTVLLDGFSPEGRVVLYRSQRSILEAGQGVRLPYDPDHLCGGTELHLQGTIRNQPAADTVRLFLATDTNNQGKAMVETVLRSTKMCEAFVYQAVDLLSCRISNLVVLSKSAHTPVVPVQALSLDSSNPYVYANELTLP